MLSTNGTTSFGKFPLPSPMTNIAANDFSISMWIEFQNVTGQATFMRMLDIINDSDNYIQIAIGSLTGNLGVAVEDATTQRGLSVDSVISADVLYHIVITWDASADTVGFSLDAVAQSGASLGNLGPGVADNFNIGRRSDDSGSTYSECFFGDLRIYDRALPQDEITSIFTQRGHDGIVDGLVARHLMDETSPNNYASLNTHYKDSTTASVESTSVTISVPTVADGDLMVAAICAGGNTSGTPAVVTTPSGWDPIGNGDLPSTSSTPSLWIYRRTASSEPATYNFAIDQTNTIIATMGTWDGNFITTTQDVISTINTGTSIAPIAPTVSPSGNALILRIAASDSTKLPSDTSEYFPSNTIGREALEATDVPTNGCTLGFSEQLVPSGATGTASFSLGSSDQWGAFTVAFLGGNADTDVATLKDISNSKNDGEPIFSPLIARDELSFRKRV